MIVDLTYLEIEALEAGAYAETGQFPHLVTAQAKLRAALKNPECKCKFTNDICPCHGKRAKK